uniref:Predicted protein n=1 Tax=Hordeum vulgare subsp. vulgare TaxID=112509 RepID=F2D7S8_HORVV|nr:predicted protein [Hordeum vulgare subsp. vulgare]
MVLVSSTPSTRAKLCTSIAALTLQLIVATLAAPIALPGCPEVCGSIAIPYPFGLGQGCFRAGFNLTCDETRHPPKLLVGDGAEVIDISLVDGTLRIHSKMLNIPLNTSSTQSNGSWSVGLKDEGPLIVSVDHNRFVATGCNVQASLIASFGDYVSVCAVYCADKPWMSDTSCSGVGCCQTPIARLGLPFYDLQLGSLSRRTGDSLEYGVVFIADQEWLAREGPMLQLNYFDNPHKIVDSTLIPTVVEWSLHVRDEGYDQLYWGQHDFDVYEPRSLSVYCFIFKDSSSIQRARCNCSKGFEGNPYIANGCQDIDECQRPDIYPCHGTCINDLGTYRCLAKKGITSLPGLITVITISAVSGILFSLLGITKITNKLKQRRAMKLRRKFFKKNHGLLLQQLISSNKDIAERTRVFSLEELEQATNKFDQNRILGGGGHGTVYKGILSDQHVVAIKKAKIVVQREIDQFINEVVILSQTNHRNVVKLFGCCLETEVPLLVYEFISNGTLSYHLHGQSENPLSWKDRLKIALETARAIAYLHSAASISVYHRDIKCANILLTDALTAKVSDFGASRSIAIDETGILTAVQGTYGYLDPEYYYTSRLTEKSDVYSFGVILAELLTRVTPVFSSHSSESTSLASHFVSLIRDNRFLDILDTQIVEEGGAEDAEVVARLTEACLSLKGEERPTMRQVETTLEDVQNLKVNLSSQITRVNQNAINDQSNKGSKGNEGTRLYSLEKEFVQSSEIPR